MTSSAPGSATSASSRPLRGLLFAVVILFTLFGGEAIRNTISWWGFAAWALILAVISAIRLVRSRRTRSAARPNGSPRRPARLLTDPLLYLCAFVAWQLASLAWSDYPGGTLLGLAVTGATLTGVLAVARTVPRRTVVIATTIALGLIAGGSLIFELVVSVVIRRPILPVFPIDVTPGKELPQAFFWSRDRLFEGGPIQGVLGNANLLGFVALLLVIFAGYAVAARLLPRLLGGTLLGVGVVVLALTRSSTVMVALLVTVFVALIALAFRRGRDGSAHRIWGWLLIGVAVAAVFVALALSGPLLALLGKSPDLTGRLDIWAAVARLFAERPVAGWGWTGYWQPWIPVFDGLATRNGVQYLQAHNAFLDVAFQLGIVGLVFFGMLCATVIARAVRSSTRTLLPLLLIAALLAQSLAESRLLYEGNWALLVLLALGLFDDETIGAPAEAGTPIVRVGQVRRRFPMLRTRPDRH